MIKITRLNKQEIYLNAELIETVEATPDTVITLTGGKTVMVRELVHTVVKRILRYRRRIYSSPRLRI